MPSLAGSTSASALVLSIEAFVVPCKNSASLARSASSICFLTLASDGKPSAGLGAGFVRICLAFLLRSGSPRSISYWPWSLAIGLLPSPTLSAAASTTDARPPAPLTPSPSASTSPPTSVSAELATFSSILVSVALSKDGPLNTLVAPPIPLPRIPAAIPTSRYSAIASGLSKDLPACQRSNTC